jgi:hypothetical protein
MKKFLYRVGDWLLTVIYFAMHRVFPQGWLTAIAHKVPYKENVYAPGGFFVAPKNSKIVRAFADFVLPKGTGESLFRPAAPY